MNDHFEDIHRNLNEINENYGGDIGFIPPVKSEAIQELEKAIGWELPAIFRFFYTTESNGLIVGNKRILSIKDQEQKKTLVDNIQQHNSPGTSYWFRNRPQTFKDYLVIGSDGDICFCLSKKYNLPDPSIYICENANSTKGVGFHSLNYGLNQLITKMIDEEFD